MTDRGAIRSNLDMITLIAPARVGFHSSESVVDETQLRVVDPQTYFLSCETTGLFTCSIELARVNVKSSA
jgi:hypothetical protein